MSFLVTARVAPEKRFHRPPAADFFRDVMEMDMYRSSYSEKLKDPRWQKKRLEIMQRDEFVCQMCFDGDSTLHVHHKRYAKGREPWESDSSDLVTVCESCHEDAHQIKDQAERLIASLSISGMPWSVQSVLPLVAGYVGLGQNDGDYYQKDPAGYVLGEVAMRLSDLNIHDLIDLFEMLKTHGPKCVVKTAAAVLRHEDVAEAKL